MSPLSSDKMSQASLLSSLPAELRLDIFRHVHSNRNDVHIPSSGKIPPGIAENLANTRISSALQHWAREAYLESLTWNFESVEAARGFVGAGENEGRVWHVSIEIGQTEVLEVLKRAGVKVRSVEIRGDVWRVFGLGSAASSGRQGALRAMQGGDEGVLEDCFERSCKVMDVLDEEKFDPARNPLLQVLASLSALESVAMEARCQLCAEHDLECDWRLVICKAELYALIGNKGRVSPGRRRRIRELEGEVARLTQELEGNQRKDSVIEIDCGMD